MCARPDIAQVDRRRALFAVVMPMDSARPTRGNHAFHMSFIFDVPLVFTTTFNISWVVSALFVCMTACTTGPMRGPAALISVDLTADTLGVFKALVASDKVLGDVRLKSYLPF